MSYMDEDTGVTSQDCPFSRVTNISRIFLEFHWHYMNGQVLPEETTGLPVRQCLMAVKIIEGVKAEHSMAEQKKQEKEARAQNQKWQSQKR